jgi:hypothetical protein
MRSDEGKVRLKVDAEPFATRVGELLAHAQDLHTYAVGPQPEANRLFRQHFLAWMAEVERALDWALEGVDVTVGLQTPRLLSIIEDRVPDLELYRAVEAELRIKMAVLSALVDATTAEGDSASSVVPRVSPPETSVRAPRTFVSHASEDKDRFVIDLARRLRASGIDAWLDDWELQPGDSLVDRIFEEGIGNADAFIVVLSKHSIAKKWVREELNAAVVKRLSEGTLLIPVLIDDVEVPQALRSTLWVKIESLVAYDTQLERIVRSIYGHTEKPALGPPPSWVRPAVPITGLAATDSIVLSLAAEQALASGHRFLDTARLLDACAKADLDPDACVESLSALDHADLLDVAIRQPAAISRLQITNRGLVAFLEVARPDLAKARRRLVAELVNRTDGLPVEGSDLIAAVGERALVVEVLLDELHARGLITLAKYIGNTMRVHRTSPLLRRELD